MILYIFLGSMKSYGHLLDVTLVRKYSGFKEECSKSFANIWRRKICYANITYFCNKSITFSWIMKWYVRLLHFTLVCEYISVFEKGVAWMGRDEKFMALHISAHSISQIRKWFEFIYPLFHHFYNFHHFDHFHHFC